MTTSLRLSLAIPVHNEESVLPELLRRTGAVLDQVPGGPHELIVVDDGSTDGTLAILEEAVQRDPRLVPFPGISATRPRFRRHWIT